MGYDIGFAPTEEMMGKYNIPLLGFNRIPELKLSLTAYCLTKQEIGKKFYEILSINLSYLQSLIESETKVNAYEQWKNEKEVWWRVFNNIDAKRDLMMVEGPLDVLDHSSPMAKWGTKVGIDATKTWPEEGHTREWPDEITMDKSIKDMVDAKWEALGLD